MLYVALFLLSVLLSTNASFLLQYAKYQWSTKDGALNLYLSEEQILKVLGANDTEVIDYDFFRGITIYEYGFHANYELSSSYRLLKESELGSFTTLPIRTRDKHLYVRYDPWVVKGGCMYALDRMQQTVKRSGHNTQDVIIKSLQYLHLEPVPPTSLVHSLGDNQLVINLPSKNRWTSVNTRCSNFTLPFSGVAVKTDNCDHILNCPDFELQGDRGHTGPKHISCTVLPTYGFNGDISVSLVSRFVFTWSDFGDWGGVTHPRTESSATSIAYTTAPAPIINKGEFKRHNGEGLYTFKTLVEREYKIEGATNYGYETIKGSCVVDQKPFYVHTITCGLKKINQSITEFELTAPAGLPHYIDFIAETGGKKSDPTPKAKRYVYYGDLLPPRDLEIEILAQRRRNLEIIMGTRYDQYYNFTEITCMAVEGGVTYQKQWEVSRRIRYSIRVELNGGMRYICHSRIKLLTSSKKSGFTNKSGDTIISLRTSQEISFEVRFHHPASRVEDGDFFFDLEMTAFYKSLNITIEKYYWTTSSYTESTHKIIKPHNNYNNTKHKNVSANISKDFFKAGLKYRFNMVINGYSGKNIDARTKNIEQAIPPSVPYEVTATPDVMTPMVFIKWTLHSRSEQDSLTIKLCRVKEASCVVTTTMTIKLESNETEGLPLQYNLDPNVLMEDGQYRLTMSASSQELTSADSTPTTIDAYTQCDHPETVNGIIGNSKGEINWYFLNGIHYRLQCNNGYILPFDDASWECLDGKWIKGFDCVSSSSVYAAVGSVAAMCILVIVRLSIYYIKKPSQKKVFALEGTEATKAEEEKDIDRRRRAGSEGRLGGANLSAKRSGSKGPLSAKPSCKKKGRRENRKSKAVVDAF